MGFSLHGLTSHTLHGLPHISRQVAFRPYVNEVLPLIIDAIQDNSDSAKRLVAVKTLGQVMSPLARASAHETADTNLLIRDLYIYIYPTS